MQLLPSAQSSSRKENFASSSKKQNLNLSYSALFHVKTTVCLKYFVNDCTLQASVCISSSPLRQKLMAFSVKLLQQRAPS